MTISLEEFQRYQQRLAELKRQQDMADGQFQEFMNQLKEEFNCDSVEEAVSLLKKSQAKQTKLESELEQAESDFQEKWKEELDE